ncbi:hypothetical protein [Pectobacterium carotovorum]|uniref:hypothetical protein n=1 Tax=Pectobacterium carotovorum TaxID=554 RepID=UPI00027E08BD|nr:hypothetical protein [Pectobacterium carotovorum]AFR02012.1 virulence regulator [Pectobacterium carotovorum subsp. carotovorum PCC21]
MNVVIIDKSPIFIQGLSVGLNDFMHNANIVGVKDIDDVWPFLEEMNNAFYFTQL